MASGTVMTSVYLLDSVKSTMMGSMLSTCKQVLQYYLYLHLNQMMMTKEAAAETIKLVSTFSDQARIPMQKVLRARKDSYKTA